MNQINTITATKNNSRDITIFSIKVTKDLLKQGFRLTDIAPRKEIPNCSIYFFENTAEIKKYLKTVHNIIIK